MTTTIDQRRNVLADLPAYLFAIADTDGAVYVYASELVEPEDLTEVDAYLAERPWLVLTEHAEDITDPAMMGGTAVWQVFENN